MCLGHEPEIRIPSCFSMLPLTGSDHCSRFCCLGGYFGKVMLSSWGGSVKCHATTAIWQLRVKIPCYSKLHVLGIYVFNNSLSLSFPPVPNFCRNSLLSASLCNYLIKETYFQKNPAFQTALPLPFSIIWYLQFVIFRKWVSPTNLEFAAF